MTRALILATAGLLFASSFQADAQTLVSIDDAYVSQDVDARTWTIGNDGVTLVAGLASTGGFRVFRLEMPDRGDVWRLELATDNGFMVAGRPYSFGSAQGGFTFQGAQAGASDGGVRLALTFDLAERQLRVTRSYVVYPGAPVVEAWTRIEATSDTGATLSSIGVWQASVAAGVVRWTSGLHPAGEPAFTRHRQELRPNRRVAIGAEGRSSESSMPWFVLEKDEARLFAGIMWSGAWEGAIERSGSGGATATIGLGDLAIVPRRSQPFETPHVFFGTTSGGDADVAAAMRTFIDRGVRHGRPLAPLVTYNTWFAYGIRIDEASMQRELDYAARVGAELFVLDAGWYRGGMRVSDFTTGLGSWEVDTARFPSGLGAVATYARERGIRFGVWTEPERVAMSTVGRPGLARERWLATINGRYDPNARPENSIAAQICLGDAEARQWVLERLIELVKESGADYLKWDNNYWINCNRSGHGHGANDGNYAHVRGMYEILEALQARFPDLIIENCSGGGNRLDVAMLRYTDVGWMDDVTTPSIHVRHNIEGIGDILPPEYLLSFVMNHETEPLGSGPDLSLYFRSRMLGVLGMTYIGAELGEERVAEMARETGTYAMAREILRDAWATLLTDQAQMIGSPSWDAIQVTSSTTGDTLICAFQVDEGSTRTIVLPKGLSAGGRYAVRSVDEGPLGSATGAELMDNGLEILAGPYSTAHVLVLDRLDRDEPPAPAAIP